MDYDKEIDEIVEQLFIDGGNHTGYGNEEKAQAKEAIKQLIDNTFTRGFTEGYNEAYDKPV